MGRGVADSTAELAALNAALDRLAPIYAFPWSAPQLLALQEAPNVLCLPAGNQSGKTEVGAAIVGRLVRREGPIYARLREPEGRPLKIWVAPQTSDKYRSNWEPRIRQRVFGGIPHGYVQSPDPRWTWVDESGGGAVYGKSQEQGFRSFESDVCDLVLFDEEPEDPRLLSSAMQRVATTNGIVVLAYTPLLGLTWTWHSLIQPTIKPVYQVGDRHWRRTDGTVSVVQWGMAENPASVAGGGVNRLVNDPTMTEAEKKARLYGEYGFAEGLIFPELAGLKAESESLYLLDSLPSDRPYGWTLTIDPNKRHGGLLVGQDHADNRYVVVEHFREGWPDSQHARAYKQLVEVTGLAPMQVPTFADPGGAGAQAILNMAEVGIWATPVAKGPGSVKASIEQIRRALWVDPSHAHPVTGILGAPRLYFIRGLHSEWSVQGVPFAESRLLWELRSYRQEPNKPPDTPIKEADDVTDCLRYHFLVRPISPNEEVWTATQAEQKALAERSQLDRLSRKAAEEFDTAIEQAKRPKRQAWRMDA